LPLEKDQYLSIATTLRAEKLVFRKNDLAQPRSNTGIPSALLHHELRVTRPRSCGAARDSTAQMYFP
jgi:hypothetical protein